VPSGYCYEGLYTYDYFGYPLNFVSKKREREKQLAEDLVKENMIRCHLLYALSVFCLVWPSHSRDSVLWAQQTQANPQPAASIPKLSIDARLVDLPVVVRDKKGTLVRNLAKTDFRLEVDAHLQEIRYFDIDSDLPLVLGLLVDTSFSQRSVIDEERSASGTFLDHMLTTPKDQAFVMQFARQAELLGDLTNSRPKLQAALKEIDTPSTNPSASDDSTGDDDSRDRQGSRRSHAGGTVLYDATFLASDELMKKQKGRKALIILSDGNDRGSKESLNKALESAQRANTIIYAIYFKGEEPQQQSWGRSGGGGRFPGGRGGGYPGGYPGGRGGGHGGGGEQSHVDGKKILKQLAEETGGRLFEVSKKQTVAQIYDQIAEELRAQYRLGYTPDQAASAEGYHRVDLTTNRKDLFVQTRDGYYGGKE
jgi:VWFA-related protein